MHKLKLRKNSICPTIAMVSLLSACNSAETQAIQTPEPTLSLQPQVMLPNCPKDTTSPAVQAYCLFNSAVLMHKAGFREEAKKEFLRVLVVDENHLLSHKYLGDIYFEEDELQLAEEMYLAVVEIDPEDSAIHENLGVIYDRTDRTDAAIASYLKSISLYPLNPEVHYKLGIAYARDRLTMNQAIDAFLEAIELDTENPRYHFDLGQVYAYIGRKTRAQTHFQKASQLGYSSQP